jgi:hypothetical protein
MKVRERNADIQKLVVCSRDGGDYVDKRLIILEIRTSPLGPSPGSPEINTLVFRGGPGRCGLIQA